TLLITPTPVLFDLTCHLDVSLPSPSSYLYKRKPPCHRLLWFPLVRVQHIPQKKKLHLPVEHYAWAKEAISFPALESTEDCFVAPLISVLEPPPGKTQKARFQRSAHKTLSHRFYYYQARAPSSCYSYHRQRLTLAISILSLLSTIVLFFITCCAEWKPIYFFFCVSDGFVTVGNKSNTSIISLQPLREREQRRKQSNNSPNLKPTTYL
ncbi:uncharacterized protein TRIVIDRAFT_168035, partial [Trichoderma virens Gv29-8]